MSGTASRINNGAFSFSRISVVVFTVDEDIFLKHHILLILLIVLLKK